VYRVIVSLMFSGPSKVEHNPFQEAVRFSICSTFKLKGMSSTMLCNATLMVRLSNFYSSFKPNISRIFCSSFKFFDNQTVRLSRVHCICIDTTEKKHLKIYYFLPVYSFKCITTRATSFRVTHKKLGIFIYIYFLFRLRIM
jgi:hypothetical protein